MQSLLQLWKPPAALFFAAALSLSSGAFAAVESEPASQKFEIGDSQPGNYLSALIASADRDTPAAELFYQEALRSTLETLISLSVHLPLRSPMETRQARAPWPSGSLRVTPTTTSPDLRLRFATSSWANLRLRAHI